MLGPVKRLVLKIPAAAFLFHLASCPAFPQHFISARAGSIQLALGEVFLDGSPLKLKEGQFYQMENGQILSTGKGHAEVLLAPNACLRLGADASLRMRRNELTDIRMELSRGSALVEISKKLKTDPIRIYVADSVMEVKKDGLYRLDEKSPRLRVYSGDAYAVKGDKRVQIKKKKTVALDGEFEPEEFDVTNTDTLHRWAAQRSFALYSKNLFYTKPVDPRSLAWRSRPDGIYSSLYHMTVRATEDWRRYWAGLWGMLRERAQETSRYMLSDPDSLLTPAERRIVPLPPENQQQ